LAEALNWEICPKASEAAVAFENDDFLWKVASTVKEATQVIEAGYEYVTKMDYLKLSLENANKFYLQKLGM
jgi:hypothetical protein